MHFWQHITLISHNPNLLKFSKHLCAEACWTVEELKALKQILLSAMAVSTFRKLASPVKRKREKLEFLWDAVGTSQNVRRDRFRLPREQSLLLIVRGGAEDIWGGAEDIWGGGHEGLPARNS